MFLQLCEPGTTPEPHAKDQAPVIGIDLGTTLSAVSLLIDGTPTLLNLNDGRLVPSAIRLKEDGSLLLGQGALDGHGGQLILSIKRFMGKNDLPGATFTAAGKTWTAVELSALILTHLKNQAEEVLGQQITQAVITVPAYFDDNARNATKQAALLAGLTPLRLLNEPTAAALAYGLEANPSETFAVYDLGGGTFDFTLLKPHQGVFQVLATNGDTHLGGDDFDRRLYDLIAKSHPHFPPFDATLHLMIRALKERFLEEEIVDYTLHHQGHFYGGKIHRADFEKACTPEINRTFQVSQQAMKDAHLSTSDISRVILVGGSTRMGAIAPAVAKFFNQEPYMHLAPDETVALGAGIAAHGLTHGSQTVLLDVTPLSLGLETMGGLVEKIIPRNTPIPTQVTQHYTTAADGQRALKIHVVQGEREQVQDCRSLAHFSLKGIPPLPAGAARIAVTFAVDVDGLLTVTAQEQHTGLLQSVEVNPTYGMNEAQLFDLLKYDLAHAREDHETRQLIQAKLTGEQLIQATRRALDLDEALLSAEALKSLKDQVNDLEMALTDENKEWIEAATEALTSASDEFAQIRLTHALKEG